MSITANEFGPRIAAFTWDRPRARRLFWIHFPLALLHLPLAFVVIGLPGLALFGYFALRSFRRWRNREAVLEIHVEGFIDRRDGYARRHTYRALADYLLIDRIMRFPFPLSFLRMHGVALVAKPGGKHFHVNEHLAGIRECIALLQEGIVRQRLPAARDALARNGTLRFGAFRMDGAGLHLGRRMLGWEAFGGLRQGLWQAGRRREPALQILDAAGMQWDVATRDGLSDPALFILLCAERRPAADTAALLEAFCGPGLAGISKRNP